MQTLLGCSYFHPQIFPLPSFSLNHCSNHGKTYLQWKTNSYNNLTAIRASSSTSIDSLEEEDDGNRGERVTDVAAKGSGTSARGRRLLKLREEKHRREQQRLHDYPSWAKYLSLFLFFSGF